VAAVATVSYAVTFAFVPVLIWMGVRDWVSLGSVGILIVLASLSAWVGGRWFPSNAGLLAGLAVTSVMVAATSVVLGPFIITPSLAAGNTAAFAMQIDRRWRPVALGIGACAFVVPTLLQWAGVVAPSYSFGPAGMTVIPRAVDFPPTATYFILMASALAFLFVITFVISQSTDIAREAEQRLHMQAWSLRQLVPESATATSAPAR
jgi:hypothetical protein